MAQAGEPYLVYLAAKSGRVEELQVCSLHKLTRCKRTLMHAHADAGFAAPAVSQSVHIRLGTWVKGWVGEVRDVEVMGWVGVVMGWVVEEMDLVGVVMVWEGVV